MLVICLGRGNPTQARWGHLKQLYTWESSKWFLKISICGKSCQHLKNFWILEFQIKNTQPVYLIYFKLPFEEGDIKFWFFKLFWGKVAWNSHLLFIHLVQFSFDSQEKYHLNSREKIVSESCVVILVRTMTNESIREGCSYVSYMRFFLLLSFSETHLQCLEIESWKMTRIKPKINK